MLGRRARALAIAAALWLVSPIPAMAQGQGTVHAPPGNGAVQEYLEVVPSAGGDRPTAAARTPEEVLGAATTRELETLGPDGRAAAVAAAVGASTQPRAPAVKRQTGVDGAPGRPGVVGDDRGRIPAIATALAGSGEGGLGLVFPLVLGGSLLAAAAFIGLRRSHRR